MSKNEKTSWDEFRNSGLLWFVNRTLHVFGWSIIIKVNDDNEIEDVYPARTTYRGFSEEDEEEGFFKLTNHIEENAERLINDVLTESKTWSPYEDLENENE